MPSRKKNSDPLDPLFSPASVALIGASERPGSVGRAALENLERGFKGKIYAVNPNHSTVLGRRSFPSIGSVGEAIDLALIATPAPCVPGNVAECAAAGVKAAIVLSAGFREIGPAGAELERKTLLEARRGNLRVLGPNCIGLMRPSTGLNATFASRLALPGHVALISQSGALCTAILDWSLKERVGFSAFISIGSMMDLGWGDFIDYLSQDAETRSILIYMESIGDAAAFLSAAREAALKKPIIVLKTGVSEAAARAAASHTGAMTGGDEILDAAFRRVGVLRVRRMAELFLMAEALAKQPRPAGPRLAIVTNAGGPGVLAVDALAAAGGAPASLSPETLKKLNAFLPRNWSRNNPIDLLGDADSERYRRAIDLALEDEGVDGVLAILTPQQMTDPTRSAEALTRAKTRTGKPLLASWMGGEEIARGVDVLNANSIPTFPYPDTAAQVFQYMWQYSENLQNLYETPGLPPGAFGLDPDRETARALLAKARSDGRTLLNESESKSLLGAYGIPSPPTRTADNAEAAAELAQEMGFPVVLKLLSEKITHKSDVGGVALNLRSAEEVREAFGKIRARVSEAKGADYFQGVTVQPMILDRGIELILGSSCDPQIGPTLLFGAGGELVEITRDRAIALPPLTTTLAESLMKGTHIYGALLGVRGRPPVDLKTLQGILLRFSQLVVEQPGIHEIDINPLLASASGILALDARVILQDPKLDPSEWPRPSIRPYPWQYRWEFESRKGIRFRIRPIRPEDEPAVAAFQSGLSWESVYSRYFSVSTARDRTRHDRLSQLCFIDYARQIVLVAERLDGKSPSIAGIGHLIRLRQKRGSEFALLVADAYQRQGLGSELLRRLIEIAELEDWEPVTALILPENQLMQEICQKSGFRVVFIPEERLLSAEQSSPKSASKVDLGHGP